MARVIAVWGQPTEREGGVPFDADTELQGSEIRVRAGEGDWSAPAPIPPTEQQFVVDNIAPGAYEFQLVHIDTGGRRSSPIFASTVILGAPVPAGDFTVTIEDV